MDRIELQMKMEMLKMEMEKEIYRQAKMKTMEKVEMENHKLEVKMDDFKAMSGAVFTLEDAEKFEKIFKVHLLKFLCRIQGFDSVKFDEMVVKSDEDEMSMRDKLIKKWGMDAMLLVENFIHRPNLPPGRMEIK